MAKMVSEVLTKLKGEDNVNDILTGKGSFSKSGFADMVSAMINDTTFKIPTYDKDGNKNGEMCISEKVREDLKKTYDKAGYPQKSEMGVLDTCNIVTTGITEAIPQLVEQWLMCGKKFEFPRHEMFNGSTYLHPVKGSVKTVQVREPATQKNLGTSEVTTQDYIQIRTKSTAPSNRKTKVRKDPSGKIISK